MGIEILNPVRASSSQKGVFTNGMTKAPRNVAWYQPSLPKGLPELPHKIFRDYSNIPDNEVVDHIYRVRDKAWEILPYPCIGVFRFLDFPATLNPIYPEVLERVRNGETFLDLGCCFGQDIRKLAFDGAPSENLIGVDTESRFLDLGYELFRDRDTLKSHFYSQDVFAEDFLSEWRGKVDIIFLGSFLHLFSFAQQKAVIAQVEKLLRKRKGALVFGRHMGAQNGGSLRRNALGWDLYHHSPETICRLFNEDEEPRGKWEVGSELVAYGSEGWDKGRNWQGNNVKQQNFWARKL